MKVYVATFHGDLEHPPMVASSLLELLYDIQNKYGYGRREKPDSIGDNSDFEMWITPDPEDDKIEIWEYDSTSKTGKIVWGFWGWHWTVPDDLDQGKMPRSSKSLYELAFEN